MGLLNKIIAYWDDCIKNNELKEEKDFETNNTI
jgi:hypothetical protein